MDEGGLLSLLEDLDSQTDSLESSLLPLLESDLSETSSKLPLLDKAKLHLLVNYTIESLIFSVLKINGVDAKSHPIFRELTRTRQYFEKIKSAENAHQETRNLTLDKDAAGRFIKHALRPNEKLDRERTEAKEAERAAARNKFEALSAQVGTTKRLKGLEGPSEDGPSPAEVEDGGEAHKKRKRGGKDNGHGSGKNHKSNKRPRAPEEVMKDLLERSEKGEAAGSGNT